MEALFAITLGLLTASGVYLLLRARTFPVVLGLTLISCSAARNSSTCCAINPTRRAFQWWKRNFRIARRVPPGYPS